ncbi:hypothetical protein [Pseudodesulfovibrio pelocollis]|uniref:hypothetical protein n=1 Tax=Pseudodesulfovibrio pelocollis TaxID=3051432 RepID=UPI00255AC05E|nr:hypothetical protein [Pseudodesulfovibrio sp. SB368]
MSRIGYEQHYGVNWYTTPLEEVALLVPERYHARIFSRVEEVRAVLRGYGVNDTKNLDTRDAGFLMNLRDLISHISCECFRFLKGEYVHGEDWSQLIEEALAFDLSAPMYHPISLEGLPQSEPVYHPVNGRLLTNVHEVSGVTVAVQWSYNGKWQDCWTAFWPAIEDGALYQIAQNRDEAIEKVKETISRFKITRIDNLYWRFSREELEGMNNRSLRGLAMVRGVPRYKTMRINALVDAILAVHERPSFEYPMQRGRIVRNELAKARKRSRLFNGLTELPRVVEVGQCLLPGFSA